MDPPSDLPLEMQSMLKRKASRDPSSRFDAKLRALLTYVTQHPELEEKIGLAWIDDDVFKMNKHTLSTVMGIKLNTLNVNLRDLEFKQQQHNKGGWTRWKKDGFRRTATSEEGVPTYSAPAMAATWAMQAQQAQQLYAFRIGKVMPQVADQFFQSVRALWMQLNGGLVKAANTTMFTQSAAEMLRQEGQQLDNAIDVLAAIISPNRADMTTYEQFVKFMAMFGPRRTAMLKIESLLRCSHRTGQWLIFDTHTHPLPSVYAAFDDNEPNCLVIRCNGSVTRVWNMPTVDCGNGQAYLVDELDRTYTSWVEYFDANPVMTMTGYMDDAYGL